MAKNLIWGMIFARLAQNWVPNFFLKVLPLLDIVASYHLYPILRKLNEPNLRKWQKT